MKDGATKKKDLIFFFFFQFVFVITVNVIVIGEVRAANKKESGIHTRIALVNKLRVEHTAIRLRLFFSCSLRRCTLLLRFFCMTLELIFAATKGDVASIKRLLGEGASPDEIGKRTSKKKTKKCKNCCLMIINKQKKKTTIEERPFITPR